MTASRACSSTALSLLAALLALGCGPRDAPAVSDEGVGEAAMPVAAATPGGAHVDALLAAVDPSSDGAHDALARPRAAGGALEALRAYVREQHDEDDGSLSAWSFGSGATRFDYDVRKASFFASGASAAAAVDEAMESHGVPAARRERARRAVLALAAQGFDLAFDGWAQNGCAAPTAKLLILDAASGGVRGIDVTPCRE